MKISQLRKIIKESIREINIERQPINEGKICYATVNGVFGVNFPKGNQCKPCGGCGNVTCNNTNLFDTLEQCQAAQGNYGGGGQVMTKN